jgi:hypothetical protein
MAGVGYEALETRISWAVKQMSTARWNFSTSKRPSASWNLSRFSESRLQAVSSTKTNSLQGLVALMRPVWGTQFQSWMVESNCSPGSPQIHAASAIAFHRSRALRRSRGRPSVTARVIHSPSSSTAFMNSSVTRTEWLAFWNWTES